MGDSHHFHHHHHHHHPRPKSQVFCDDDDDDLDFPERSSSSTGLIRHSETHHSVQSQSQNKSELEQLRSRVCQMEKTMRWWSDCTSNWKQKWSQVRQERNALRAQLKEISGGNVAPKPEMKSVTIQTDQSGSGDHRHQMGQMSTAQNMSTAADVHLLTKLLDEAQRTITIEREEKLHLHRSIERLQQDLVEFHSMYDELVKEVQLLKLDDNSKVSEVDQDVVEAEDACASSSSAVKSQREQRDRQAVELVETRVDDDDEDDNVEGDTKLEDDEEEDNVLLLQDHHHLHHNQGSVCGIMTNDTKRMMAMMSNSKSQQISSKPIITNDRNDADHHTSL